MTGRVARGTMVATGALLFVLLGVGRPATGQGLGSESTLRYDVEITIEESGSIVVTETIVQDFGSTERHGIIREIPERLRYDETSDRVYPIEVVSVETSPGAPDDVALERSGSYLAIRIGDPDRTITGRHTYTITYRVEGAMNGFEPTTSSYWNASAPSGSSHHPRERPVSGPVPITRVVRYAGPRSTCRATRRDRGRHRRAFPRPTCSRTTGCRSRWRCRRAPWRARPRSSRSAGAWAVRSTARP
jgi:hypothetical protein